MMSSSSRRGSRDKIRTVKLRQNEANSKLGFSLRGGKEATGSSVGVFVSHVERCSEAHKKGLKVGDQLIQVNGLCVDQATYDEVIGLIKRTPRASEIILRVLYQARIPFQERAGDPIRWLSLASAHQTGSEDEQNGDADEEEFLEVSYEDEGIESYESKHVSSILSTDSNEEESSSSCYGKLSPQVVVDKDNHYEQQVGNKNEKIQHLDDSAVSSTFASSDSHSTHSLSVSSISSHSSTSQNEHETETDPSGEEEAAEGPSVLIRVAGGQTSEEPFGCGVVKGPDEWPGIFVQTVRPDSLAARAGLEPGDQLIKAAEQPLAGYAFEDAIKMIKRLQRERRELELEVRKGAALRYLAADRMHSCAHHTKRQHDTSGLSNDCFSGGFSGTTNDNSDTKRQSGEETNAQVAAPHQLQTNNSKSVHRNEHTIYTSDKWSSPSSEISKCTGKVNQVEQNFSSSSSSFRVDQSNDVGDQQCSTNIHHPKLEHQNIYQKSLNSKKVLKEPTKQLMDLKVQQTGRVEDSECAVKTQPPKRITISNDKGDQLDKIKPKVSGKKESARGKVEESLDAEEEKIRIVSQNCKLHQHQFQTSQFKSSLLLAEKFQNHELQKQLKKQQNNPKSKSRNQVSREMPVGSRYQVASRPSNGSQMARYLSMDNLGPGISEPQRVTNQSGASSCRYSPSKVNGYHQVVNRRQNPSTCCEFYSPKLLPPLNASTNQLYRRSSSVLGQTTCCHPQSSPTCCHITSAGETLRSPHHQGLNSSSLTSRLTKARSMDKLNMNINLSYLKIGLSSSHLQHLYQQQQQQQQHYISRAQSVYSNRLQRRQFHANLEQQQQQRKQLCCPSAMCMTRPVTPNYSDCPIDELRSALSYPLQVPATCGNTTELVGSCSASCFSPAKRNSRQLCSRQLATCTSCCSSCCLTTSALSDTSKLKGSQNRPRQVNRLSCPLTDLNINKRSSASSSGYQSVSSQSQHLHHQKQKRFSHHPLAGQLDLCPPPPPPPPAATAFSIQRDTRQRHLTTFLSTNRNTQSVGSATPTSSSSAASSTYSPLSPSSSSGSPLTTPEPPSRLIANRAAAPPCPPPPPRADADFERKIKAAISEAKQQFPLPTVVTSKTHKVTESPSRGVKSKDMQPTTTSERLCFVDELKMLANKQTTANNSAAALTESSTLIKIINASKQAAKTSGTRKGCGCAQERNRLSNKCAASAEQLETTCCSHGKNAMSTTSKVTGIITSGRLQHEDEDNKRRQHEMLMKEFKSAHSRMFKRRQAVATSQQTEETSQNLNDQINPSSPTNQEQQRQLKDKEPNETDGVKIIPLTTIKTIQTKKAPINLLLTKSAQQVAMHLAAAN